MMKKSTGAFLLFCLVANAGAQINRADSLIRLLQTEKKDTARALLLSRLAHVYTYSKPDTTLLLASEGLSIARQARFARGEANCLDAISDAYDNLGNYPKSLENSLQSLKIYETLGNAGGIRRCLGALGNLYAEQGDYRKALEYSFRAKEMSDNNEGALSIHLLNIGDDYNQLKIFDSARIYNQQSYDLAMRSHNTDIIGCALTNLGETHMGTSENSLALEYLRLAIPHLQEAVDDDILCEAYMQMAMIFAKTGKRDSCLHFAQLSFATAQKSSFTKRMYDASSFLARYYKDHKNVDSAFAFQQIQMNMKDSLFSQEKVKEIENLTFQEKLRQQEIAEEKQRAEKERKNNLQLMGISAFIVSFLLLFMLIIRRKTNSRTVEFFGVVGLLLVFEFISLFIHPYIEEWTGQAPVYMLVILVSIAAILAPIHHGMEKFVKAKMAHKIGLG